MTGRDLRDDLLDEADAHLREVRLRYDDERVAIWRWRARLQLRRASALALAVIARENLLLPGLLNDMSPRDDWPRTPVAYPRPMPLEPLLRDERKGFGFGGSLEDRAFERRHEHDGCVIRLPSHPAGRLGFSVFGGELAVCVDLGSCRLAACGSTAMLRLPPGIPDAVLGSCAGRPVTDVVEHPLFANGGHVVGSVRSIGRSSNALLAFRDEVVALEPSAVGIREWPPTEAEIVEPLLRSAPGVSAIYVHSFRPGREGP